MAAATALASTPSPGLSDSASSAAAPALAERYPAARCLPVLREPVARIRSAVNFLRANPFDGVMGHPPWIWMS